MMVHKTCSWGLCKSDSRRKDREDMKGVTFKRFPQPKTQPERCLEWIRRCNRLHSELHIGNIGYYHFVCSKHFLDGAEDPLSASNGTKTPVSRQRRSNKHSSETLAKQLCSEIPTCHEENQTDLVNEFSQMMEVDKSQVPPAIPEKISRTGQSDPKADDVSANGQHEDDGSEDDVVIMEEGNQGKLSNEDKLDLLSRTVDHAKEFSKQAQQEIAAVRKELESVQSNLEDSVYENLQFLCEHPQQNLLLPVSKRGLEKMIDKLLENLTTKSDLGDLTKEEYEAENEKLNSIERANQCVSKLFLECHSRLKEFRQNLLAETAEIEKGIQEYERKMSQACLLIDSDEEDDDDVKVLGASAGTRTSRLSSVADSVDHQRAQVGSSPHKLQPSSHSLLTSSCTSSSIPSMDQLRSQFASAVSRSMPTLLSSLQSQQAWQAPPLSSSSASSSALQQTKPPSQPVRWPELKLQDKVLGKKFNDVWYSGTVLDIYPASATDKSEWKCKVKFDGKGLKILPGRHVAYRDPINCFVRVGTRVVALYREDDAPNTFFAGVIAEAPSFKNNRRFLVFFDDGYAQYCEAKELHKVYMQSQNVWEDINPDTSAFIREYLRIYPERPMVRLSKGQVVRTEWNGKWWTAKVQETDASLVKMYFQADKRTEWIYRGSTRLEPLFKALANADAIKAAGSARGRRHNLTMKPSDSQKKPSVEYTRGVSEDDNQTPTAHVARAKPSSSSSSKGSDTHRSDIHRKKANVAKKSSGGAQNLASGDIAKVSQWEAPWIPYQRKALPGTQRSRSLDSAPDTAEKGMAKAEKLSTESRSTKDIASVLQERLAATANSEVEFDEENATGERKDIILNLTDKVRQPYVNHQCNPACVQTGSDNPDKFKGRNALLIPVLCGWERQVCKCRPSCKRQVIYRAPCGRRLRNIEELDQYLLITNSNLTIDLFCFDHHLHVNTEFVPVKTFCDIKDMSYGKENYPISCVNGIDRHYPDYVEYSVHRIPSQGVRLNLDPDFLVCCDCTDNCRDRNKCKCQQMTVENTLCIGDIDSEAGYHYRRLPEPLFTGIVECNSRCKCDKRCANRVAQQGLSMRLQVFKTQKKGWGLRCLDDIAKGSFICIYAGQLLTDKNANEDGKQYGDEYLAELDFIEVVERQKEGYESDVEDMYISDDEKDANYKASKDSENDSDYSQSNSPPTTSIHRDRHPRRNPSRSSHGRAGESEMEENTEKSDRLSSSETDRISISDDEGTAADTHMQDEQCLTSERETKTGGDPDSGRDASKKEKLNQRARKSTGGSRFNLSTSFKMSQEPTSDRDKTVQKKERVPTRSFFNDDTECYIMDAKSMGNLGRYLNHSCSPNVFVQNIFVDTHDLRFPWVAFFAGQFIRAGTELTWDYNYEVGSVPDKVLYCYCGSSTCRGRLL